MKRTIILIIFSLLYFFNYEICNYIFTGGVDALSLEEWVQSGDEWTSLRYNLYELMFLLVLISSFITQDKYTRSTTLLITTIIIFSLIDKMISGIVTRHIHDIVIIGFAFFVSSTFHWYENHRITK